MNRTAFKFLTIHRLSVRARARAQPIIVVTLILTDATPKNLGRTLIINRYGHVIFKLIINTINKQLLDEVFVICGIINVEVRVISRAEGEADNSDREVDNFAYDKNRIRQLFYYTL